MSKQELELRFLKYTLELERQRDVAEGFRDIFKILNSKRPFEEVLDYIVGKAKKLMDADDVGIYRLEVTGNILRNLPSRGMNPPYVTGLKIPLDKGVVGKAIQTRQPLVLSDMSVIKKNTYESMPDPEQQQYLDQLFKNVGALIAVPLIIKEEAYGGLHIYYKKPRPLSDEDVALAVTICDQAALAIEHERLDGQTREMVVAAERNRLARELHDAVTQTLFSASLIAEVLPIIWDKNQADARLRLEELRQLTKGALAEMRTLLLELRPSTIVEAELGALMKQLAEATTGSSRIPVEVRIKGKCSLMPDVQIALYRIAQESLNNVARHSSAAKAEIGLSCDDGRITLVIEDNGRGFDLGPSRPESLGLSIMRERSEAINAKLRIQSKPGKGTKVSVVWTRPKGKG
jgi:two-component system nitrate/nitrite sensor histidine kinase NarX